MTLPSCWSPKTRCAEDHALLLKSRDPFFFGFGGGGSGGGGGGGRRRVREFAFVCSVAVWFVLLERG